MVFMDITGAFCGGFCFFWGIQLEIMSSHTWNPPNRSDRYAIMGSGIYHAWVDETQLPFLSLRKSIYFGSTVKRAPF